MPRSMLALIAAQASASNAPRPAGFSAQGEESNGFVVQGNAAIPGPTQS